MKHFLLLSLTLFVGFSMMFGQFSEDFNDGNFSVNPTWAGENTKFIVENGLLRLNASSTSRSAYLSTASSVSDHLRIAFDVFMDFNPSSANYGQIHFLSDHQIPDSANFGYALELGSSKDNFTLFQRNDGLLTPLINSSESVLTQDSIACRVIINSSPQVLLITAIDLATLDTLWVDSTSYNPNISVSYFSLQPTYTSTRSDRFYFDNISVDGIVESISPSLNTVKTEGLNQVVLAFSEPIHPFQIEQTNFNIDGIAPNEIAVHSDSITLEWSLNFENGTHYNLTMSGIKDVHENEMADTSVVLQFIQPDSIHPKDVTINEIHFDPYPEVALPPVEYIEMRNNSDRFINLRDLQLVNGTRAMNLGNKFLFPGSLIVLCDASDTSNFDVPTLGVASFPNLSNSGDSLSLITSTGLVIDQVNYLPSWIKEDDKRSGGWSLEAINPIANCLGAENFDASTSFEGGTPGAENSILDLQYSGKAPSIVHSTITSASSAAYEFKSDLTREQREDLIIAPLRNYEITSIGTEENHLLIEWTPELQENDSLVVQITGAKQCLTQQEVDTTIALVFYARPKKGDLKIFEIMFNPAVTNGSNGVEYVAVNNPTGKNLLLSGVTINGGIIEEALTIAPNAVKLICNEPDTTSLQIDSIETIGVSGFKKLPNTKGEIHLISINGDTILNQKYHANWHDKPQHENRGISLKLVPNTLFCHNNRYAWKSSYTNPGRYDNEPFSFPTKALGINKAYFVDSVFRFVLNQPLLNLINAEINGHDAQLEIGIYDDEVVLSGNPGEGLLTFTAQSCVDSSLLLVEKQLSIPQSPVSHLRINEIMYDPEDGMAEYIELKNASAHPIYLDQLDIQVNSSTAKTIADNGRVIEGNGYALFCSDTSSLFTRYPISNPTTTVESTASLPILPNTGARITLAGKEGQVIEEIHYEASWHFGELLNTKGVSLERINPQITGDNARNWTSAATEVNYGSPGKQNSQYLNEKTPGVFEINPLLISPNNDGFDDIAQISLTDLGVNSTVKIDVYSKNGVHVASVTEEVVAQKTNVFVWNGEDKYGFRLPVGIYLIVATAKQNGKTTIFKKAISIG